ncbi:MAG: sigma-70 family RNA polymerase sigma factor [Chitinophagales bacterium]|nr:sigma-70 family RNA polymerase sigma factor [Chitinophagales bacterium]
MQEIIATFHETMPATATAQLTDEEKEILAAKQNAALFQPLYERYYEAILKFVYQRVVTKDDAFDITQQVFLQAMLSIKKYELRGFPFSSWLYRIAINELNKAFRKNEKQRGINLSEEHLHDISDEIGTAETEQREQAVLQALTMLNEDDYQLVEMRFFEKRAFKEIGEILNLSEATAKMRVYRILEKLKPSVERNLLTD